MPHQPQGAAFDIVLLFHVGSVAVGLASMLAGAATAARLQRALSRPARVPGTVLRYFRPGVNWAARTVYAIPVSGAALLAMSQGAYTWRDGWVMAGLGAFVAVALLAEIVLWPVERRLQSALAAHTADTADTADPAPGGRWEAPARREARLMVRSSSLALLLILAGSALMVAQP